MIKVAFTCPSSMIGESDKLQSCVMTGNVWLSYMGVCKSKQNVIISNIQTK